MKVGNGFPLHKENELIGDDGWDMWWRCSAAGPKKKTNLEEEHWRP